MLIGPVDGASVLDLFAGSGAMGMEALSRGAGRAVFVEKDGDAVRAIERNLDKLRLRGATILHPWNRDLCETEDVICAPDWPRLEAKLAPVLAG